ncbi:hypothetical protein [Brunnivagina elsteri]|uniref:Uncharacterized protein n=1 Tax=Brunnivagina elsteri CCALA 953 TaxID=987040 RepID=A0A2A2TRB5_9CYAN|nr:hypothetical protein [Calothrix elsteri]PAX60698.1 hypothetical protein CK510_00355 [Calothrix elsteri CCALA 953]
MFNLKKTIISLVLLPVASISLFAGVANAETLKTRNYKVTITRNCPEGYVTCNNVTYVGKNLKTGQSIRLKGKTIHTIGADGVTPSRFLGYEFRNNKYLYRVTADGVLTVFNGKKLVLQEKGALTY